ncbi:MAG TPA: hypothetical protein VMV83_13870 [Rectinemataceae bacterium]|nr:hypothetical protein [Rectinemataceae bacterium]
MNADLRASLLVGAVAAGLSMLVGLIARVLFVPLLFRAVLFGLLFGGLTWGVAALLRTYVPDLFGASGQDGEARFSDTETAEEQLGSSVDIVLDGSEDEVISAEELGGERFAPDSMREEGAGTEIVTDVAPVSDFPGAVASEAPITDLVEDREESAIVPSRQTTGLDELDILPDLDALAGSYGGFDTTPSGGSDDYSQSASVDESRPASSTRGSGSSDPATLAAAVRTMLKRDQKG